MTKEQKQRSDEIENELTRKQEELRLLTKLSYGDLFPYPNSSGSRMVYASCSVHIPDNLFALFVAAATKDAELRISELEKEFSEL